MEDQDYEENHNELQCVDDEIFEMNEDVNSVEYDYKTDSNLYSNLSYRLDLEVHREEENNYSETEENYKECDLNQK